MSTTTAAAAAAPRERSHSYDESFLSRDPKESLQILRTPPPPRAAEAPPSFQYAVYRTNFGKSRCYAPPATHFVPPQRNSQSTTTPFVASSASLRGVQQKKQQQQQVPKQPTEAAAASVSDQPAVVSSLSPQHPTTQRSYHSHAPLRDSVSSAIVREEAGALRSPQSNPSTTSVPEPLVREESDKPFDEKSNILNDDDDDDDDDNDDEARIIPRTARRRVQITAPTPEPIMAPQNNEERRRRSPRKKHSTTTSTTRATTTTTTPPQQQPLAYHSDPGGSTTTNNNNNSHGDILNRFSIPPPHISMPRDTLEYPTEDISMYVLQKNADDTSLSSNEQQEQQKSSLLLLKNRRRRPIGGVLETTTDDDDSLFDFDERKHWQQQQQQQQQQHQEEQNYETDDTSMDHSYGHVVDPTTSSKLPRSAWKRKPQQKHHNMGSSTTMTMPSAAAAAAATTKTKPQQHSHPTVSFGKDPSIQYYYTPEEEEEDTTLDTSTLLGGRSVNSLYTKSAESEVEDIIKDIFLIGSGEGSRPGRRKLKYCPQVKHRLQQQQAIKEDEDETPTVDEEEEEDTLEDDDEDDEEEEDSQDATPPAVDVKSLQGDKSPLEEEDDEEDPLAGLWNFFFGPEPSREDDDDEDFDEEPPEETATTTGGLCKSSKQPVLTCTKKESGFQEFLDYASDLLLGGDSMPSQEEPPAAAKGGRRHEASDHETPYDERTAKSSTTKRSSRRNKNNNDNNNAAAGDRTETTTATKPSTPLSLEEDPRLVELASQAARSMHRIRGQEFDESYDISFPDDIKFHVMDLEMPLGLIFQENDVGCWVTKVLPNGSASMNGRVHVGDQLAAIDGVSAIHMTVSEIATIIKDKKSAVELTFMRYAGPLHPTIGNVSEEGYEVRAKLKQPRPALNHTGLSSTPEKSPSNSSIPKQPRAPEQAAGRKSSDPRSKQPEKRRFRLFGRRKAA